MWLLASIGGLNCVSPPVDLVFVQWDYPLLPLQTVQTAFDVTIAKITARFVSLRLAQRNPATWLCLILVLIVLPATFGMGPVRGGVPWN